MACKKFLCRTCRHTDFAVELHCIDFGCHATAETKTATDARVHCQVFKGAIRRNLPCTCVALALRRTHAEIQQERKTSAHVTLLAHVLAFIHKNQKKRRKTYASNKPKMSSVSGGTGTGTGPPPPYSASANANGTADSLKTREHNRYAHARRGKCKDVRKGRSPTPQRRKRSPPRRDYYSSEDEDSTDSEWLQYFRQESKTFPYVFTQARNDGKTYDGYSIALLSLHRALQEGVWWWRRRKLLQMVQVFANFASAATGSFQFELPGNMKTGLHWCHSNLRHILASPKQFTHAHVVVLSKAQFDEICRALA